MFGPSLAPGNKTAGCSDPIARSSLEGAEALMVEEHFRVEDMKSVGLVHKHSARAGVARLLSGRGHELEGTVSF